jgi:hypothetical protein
VNAYAKIFLLRCEEATALASQSYERSLDRPERLALGIHTILCHPCRRFRHQVELLHQALGQIDQDPAAMPTSTMPADARDRLRDAIRRAQNER